MVICRTIPCTGKKNKTQKPATTATFFSQLYSYPSHFYFWKWRWKIIFRVWLCVERARGGYPLCDISVAVTVSTQNHRAKQLHLGWRKRKGKYGADRAAAILFLFLGNLERHLSQSQNSYFLTKLKALNHVFKESGFKPSPSCIITTKYFTNHISILLPKRPWSRWNPFLWTKSLWRLWKQQQVFYFSLVFWCPNLQKGANSSSKFWELVRKTSVDFSWIFRENSSLLRLAVPSRHYCTQMTPTTKPPGSGSSLT